MLRRRATEIAAQERRQRRALIVFAFVGLLLAGLCALISFRLLTLPGQSISAGQVSDYADGRFRRLSVPRLNTSSMIVARDSVLSEDPIFVRRTPDGRWIALLGVDTASGCFLYWDEPNSQFLDANCQGARYDIDGTYLGGLGSATQLPRMARLAVEVRDGQVFVRDELARE